MKKIFLMLMLCIISTVAICQRYYKIHSNTIGVWNTYSQTYDWGSKCYVEMELTMKGKIILISDDAGSAYVTGKQILSQDKYEYFQFMWEAVDEKQRSCNIKLLSPKINGQTTGSCQLYVFYNDFAYMYDVSFE